MFCAGAVSIIYTHTYFIVQIILIVVIGQVIILFLNESVDAVDNFF